jgi:hypothetical protein
LRASDRISHERTTFVTLSSSHSFSATVLFLRHSRTRRRLAATGSLALVCALGCGSDGDGAKPAAAGGSAGSAGTSGLPGASGGATIPGSGGAVVGAGGAVVGVGGAITGAGGGTVIGTGGVMGASGSTGNGGASMGGATGTGGAAGASGTPGNGGASGAGGGGNPSTLAKFSFFVTSFAALKRLSNNQEGFGGDLRFGETGPGAGLRGADKICTAIAETSMPGSGAKGWHAFLSAANDGTGKQVNAIDRIGKGPWYDRIGRVFGMAIADITATRPTMADPAIKNDFPNEDGVPNHAPDPTMGAVDNHDMLTGSDATGKLYNATATCLDWTAAVGDTAKEGKPRCGHSWIRSGGMTGGMGEPWMSTLTESGCKAGANLIEMGGPQRTAVTVGSGGGYGGFYCFAMMP